MDTHNIISVVLSAHAPFIRHPELIQSNEEQWFFESLSETYIPLLQAFDRLDKDRIPFRIGISISPIMCHLLSDNLIIERYLEYTDKQIDFGVEEMERTKSNEQLYRLAERSHKDALDRRFCFMERYEKNILKVFDYYQRKGKIELLTTAATHAFLPFYAGNAEATQTQLEVAVTSHRSYFGKYPYGFWLPELGWTPELSRYLRAYNFAYTIIDTHGLIFANPPANKGSFFPIKTPQGIFVFARDYYVNYDLTNKKNAFANHHLYRDNDSDVAYKLPQELLSAFLGKDGSRKRTGYKYETLGGKGQIYDPEKVSKVIKEQVSVLLDSTLSRLEKARTYMESSPISLCTYSLNTFGHSWYEGVEFLETFFREGAKRENLHFLTPAEYLYKQNISEIQNTSPEFSAKDIEGYAGIWLSAKNDWIYKHIIRALERMTELAERFPNETGIKDRALNQAAREILLAQSSDWARMIYNNEFPDYAHKQVEEALRNFTTIYEALGSNYISTEWLTNLERRHNIFPNINYRVFRRKQ